MPTSVPEAPREYVDQMEGQVRRIGLLVGDLLDLARLLGPRRSDVEVNIEGDPRPELLDMVRAVRPHQCTLVPVRPGEITSQAGWPPDTPADVTTVPASTTRWRHVGGQAQLRDAEVRRGRLAVEPAPCGLRVPRAERPRRG